MYTNPVAGFFIRHKCYDPKKPNNHTTVQFLFNDLTIKCIIPLSTMTGRQHFKNKSAQRYHHQRWYIYIYIHMYIHTPNTHIFVKKQHVFPQSNTNIRTTSPGAYSHTIVSCCVCFFLFRKKLKCWHIKANFSTTVISAIFKWKEKKTSSLRQVMHISCLLLDTNLDLVVDLTSLASSPGFKLVSLDD